MLTYHPPLCVAETASVFGEMLLTDMMLKDADSDELKRDILCSEIEGVINTCSRQIMYIAFERELHEKGAKQRLDSDALSKMWANHENKIYGETITPHEDQKYFWARVGHFFFARFYCFAYAFGKLFVLALYQRYLEDPDSFKPAYKEMLQSGGQVPPHLLAEKLDMDISSEEFWQSGFDYMKKRIEELEELVG
ncbi:MAG: M3 family metallopeptidase [Planctomycetota bacterium]|nr:M3 family metallopeptidase [Planctomycetota bacterium]